jgi:hypothetical protein
VSLLAWLGWLVKKEGLMKPSWARRHGERQALPNLHSGPGGRRREGDGVWISWDAIVGLFIVKIDATRTDFFKDALFEGFQINEEFLGIGVITKKESIAPSIYFTCHRK